MLLDEGVSGLVVSQALHKLVQAGMETIEPSCKLDVFQLSCVNCRGQSQHGRQGNTLLHLVLINEQT